MFSSYAYFYSFSSYPHFFPIFLSIFIQFLLLNFLVDLLFVACQRDCKSFIPSSPPEGKEIVDCIFGYFFKCQETAMSSFLIEYPVECYRCDVFFLTRMK